jgi:hypothetical protein
VLGSVGFIFLETCLSVKCKLLWPRVGREGKRREEKRSKERDVTVDGGCVISTRVKLQSIRFARFCKRLSLVVTIKLYHFRFRLLPNAGK